MAFPLAAAAAIGGVASYLGQRSANKANKQIASETTAANMADAQANRDFQERMSNTEVSRRMKDLQSAGMNPLLAATGGASTPSGAQGSAQGYTAEDAMSKGVASALEAGLAKSQVDLQKENVKQVKESVEETKAATAKTKAETVLLNKGKARAEAEEYLWNKAKESTKSSIKENWKNWSKFVTGWQDEPKQKSIPLGGRK